MNNDYINNDYKRLLDAHRKEKRTKNKLITSTSIFIRSIETLTEIQSKAKQSNM